MCCVVSFYDNSTDNLLFSSMWNIGVPSRGDIVKFMIDHNVQEYTTFRVETVQWYFGPTMTEFGRDEMVNNSVMITGEIL